MKQDNKLKEEERKADEIKWKTVASKMGHDFTPEECRSRYVDYHQVMEQQDVDEEALEEV